MGENMKEKTSFVVNESLQLLEQNVLDKTGIPRTLLHNKAFAEFLKGERYVQPRLLIKKKSDPGYVRREKIEQAYIEAEIKAEFQRIAKEKKCTASDLYFQALLDYCCKQIKLFELNL